MSVNATVWTFALADVPLTRFEVPEEFDIGHDIEQVVHRYLSETGQPIVAVQNLGAFPIPTSWRGILYGNTAVSRMQTLDALAVNQLPIPWQFGPLSWQVAIKQFKATPKYNNEIHYEITLTVIQDLNGSVQTLDSGVSFDVGTQDFYDTATAAATALATSGATLPSSLTQSMSASQTGFVNASPLKTASYTTLFNLINQLEDTVSELNAYITPLQETAVLEADLNALNQALIALQGFGLLQQNVMQLIGLAQGSVQQVLFQGSLFHLATQYYPNSDPEDIVGLIAQANNLNDYFLDTQAILILPPVFS